MMNAIFKRLLGAGLVTASLLAGHAAMAQTALTDYKIGFQKTGLPVVAQRLGTIETALKAQGIAVTWVEFQAGPPLVEALNVGAIDAGWVGDAPPIFGQAGGANIVYVAALPSNGAGEAVFVKDSSPIATIADLKGKKVGVGKGTSANNLLIAALQHDGLAYTDIEPVYLSPADAAAAFASDSIDAWVVWDPFFAIAETQNPTRVLVRSSDILDVNTYFLANGDFAKAHGDVLTTTIAALGEAAAWADAHRDEVAAALHEVTGVPLEAQTIAANRAKFGVWPITDAIVTGQQATADRFFDIGLIPVKVVIKDAVWTAN
ncbi:MAG: putative transporter, substrate binding protein [Devosia sp.]|nr:putative transporter, substrate binding protein [Devosia sp.]